MYDNGRAAFGVSRRTGFFVPGRGRPFQLREGMQHQLSIHSINSSLQSGVALFNLSLETCPASFLLSQEAKRFF